MNKITQSFVDLKKNTPRHVLWLLMAAAFIAVLILLTILIGGRNKKVENTPPPVDEPVPQISIDVMDIDWTETKVGESVTQKITVGANEPVVIVSVRPGRSVPGFVVNNTCERIGQISASVTCAIYLEYAPYAARDITPSTVSVEWRGLRQPAGMEQTEIINIALGAYAEPEPEPLPVPVVVEEPVELPPAQLPPPLPAPEPELPLVASESCSDFAFGGYNLSGQQIGWIKPEAGTYRFYLFGDKNCEKPAGVYNPSTGVITDILDPSKKLGTDSDNIGRGVFATGTIPQLSNPPAIKTVNRARQVDGDAGAVAGGGGRPARVFSAPPPENLMTSSGNSVTSSQPFDRSFILRQYKPIPATIVSEVRADTKTLEGGLPVRATVDRNVFADNGRNIIIPAGTLMLGYVTGELPGPYKTIGRMKIEWYQFILPNGVEFNFAQGQNPFSGDSQGRVGVPGYGSSDYIEQFFMPMLTAIVPAAVNMIAPITDKFVNQIDLDNNTVTQSGQIRSSELAKNEIITSWNRVANKLMVDMLDNTVPPFSIAAGTRINVFSPVDLQVTCGDPNKGDTRKCAIAPFGAPQRFDRTHDAVANPMDGSWVGQVRGFNFDQFCLSNGQVDPNRALEINEKGMDYRTVLFYCQSRQYVALNNARQDALFQNQQANFVGSSQVSQGTTSGVSGQPMLVGSQQYNEQVLGMKYNEDGTLQNPFASAPQLPTEQPPAALMCEDGTPPSAQGCCTGEVYTDMGDQGFNCCLAVGEDCFPPLL